MLLLFSGIIMAFFVARFTSLTSICLAFLLFLNRGSFAAPLAEWRNRSIYQVLTDRFAYGDGSEIPPPCQAELGLHCGGTWRGIRANLDYIQGMNFDAIWISPVVAQLPQRTGDGEAYTAYWQQDLYALNPKFGTKEDLQELIGDVHERGMYLMLDIVVNHFGYADANEDIDYSIFNPFNEQKYFHDYCGVSQPDNQTDVQQCWLGDGMVPLVDLRTEDLEVQNMYGEWISEMVANYSIDGLRIDTSINVDPPFFVEFVKAAGVFATGEVMHGDDELACQWADPIGSILNYPIYYPLTRAFQDPTGSINDLVETIDSVKSNCNDPTAFGSFSENHDVPRFANYTSDMSLAKNLVTYTMMADGIPIIYQGQEQHMNGDVDSSLNRAPLWETGYNTSAPLYRHIATLNQFRQHVLQASTNYTEYRNEVVYQDLHTLGMRKGFNGSQVITVLNNNGQGTDDYQLALPNHGFAAGTELTEILTCTNLKVDGAGFLHLPIEQGHPKVLYPTHLLSQSSLCGRPDPAPAPAHTTSSQTSPTAVPNGYAPAHTMSSEAGPTTLADEYTSPFPTTSPVAAETTAPYSPPSFLDVPPSFPPIASYLPEAVALPSPLSSHVHDHPQATHQHHGFRPHFDIADRDQYHSRPAGDDRFPFPQNPRNG